jgi:hypothetical protein
MGSKADARVRSSKRARTKLFSGTLVTVDAFDATVFVVAALAVCVFPAARAFGKREIAFGEGHHWVFVMTTGKITLDKSPVGVDRTVHVIADCALA